MKKNAWIIAILTVAIVLMAFQIIGTIEGAAEAESQNEPQITYEDNMQVVYQNCAENATQENTQDEDKSPEDPTEIYGMDYHIYKLTDEERELIVKVIASEARGESLECMMGCAQTIRDRAITRDKSITEIVTAPLQFAAPYAGTLSDGLRERIESAVMFVFDYGHTNIEYPVLNFFSEKVLTDPADWPTWAFSKEYITTLDGVRFYR